MHPHAFHEQIRLQRSQPFVSTLVKPNFLCVLLRISRSGIVPQKYDAYCYCDKHLLRENVVREVLRPITTNQPPEAKIDLKPRD